MQFPVVKGSFTTVKVPRVTAPIVMNLIFVDNTSGRLKGLRHEDFATLGEVNSVLKSF